MTIPRQLCSVSDGVIVDKPSFRPYSQKVTAKLRGAGATRFEDCMARKPVKVPSRIPSVDQLRDEHQELDRRLNHLERRTYLTPAEQIERQTIKKLKLLKKDQIAILTRRANA